MSLLINLKIMKDVVSSYKGKSCIVTQCYAELKDFIPLLSQLDLDPNPRNPSRSAIVIDIVKTLEESSYLYPALSRGLIIACSSCSYQSGGSLDVVIRKDEYFAQGILDGAHNALALISYATGKKPKGWAEAKAALVLGLRSDLSKVVIPLSFISPNPNCALTHEQIKADLDKIKETRNSSVSVSKVALATNRGTLDSLRSSFSDKLNKRIAWVPDRSKSGRLPVQTIANLLIHIFHALGEDHPIASLLCSPALIVDSPSKAFSCVEDILKEHGEDPLVVSCFQYVEEVANLFDYIQLSIINHLNMIGKRWTGAIKKSPKTLFFNHPLDTHVGVGVVHPFVHAVVVGSFYVNQEELKKRADLCDIFDQIVGDNIEEFYELFNDCGRDEKRFGKNKVIYTSFARSVKKDCRRIGV